MQYIKVLKNKWAIVTGSTSGIGLETARALYLCGCNVVICCRSLSSGELAAEELKSSALSNKVASPGVVIVEELDLANLRSVTHFAESVLTRVPCIDILICNAGIMATPFGTTVDGFETQLGTNHIGHQALVQAVLPAMLKVEHSTKNEGRPPPRIIILTSTSHRWGSICLEDLHFTNGRRYNPWIAYAQSKLACLLLATELASRLKAQNSSIKVAVLHPGIIFTAITRHRSPSCMTPVFKFLLSPMTKSPSEGAATTVYAAGADIPSGSYLEDCDLASPAANANNAQLAKQLFETTELMISTALTAADPKSPEGSSALHGGGGRRELHATVP